MELNFIPQWAVTDLESCFPSHTFMGSPRTGGAGLLSWVPLHGVLPVKQSP